MNMSTDCLMLFSIVLLAGAFYCLYKLHSLAKELKDFFTEEKNA